MKHFKFVTTSIVSIAIIYALGVFVSLEPNVVAWDAPSRFTMCIAWVVLEFWVAVAIYGEA